MTDESDFQKLISLLKSSDPAVRHGAAMRLSDLRDNRAVEPLFQAIANPANAGYTGTLIYALLDLDCSGHFTDLFDLALHGVYEVQCKALMILEEQDFVIEPAQVAKARENLAAFLANPHQVEEPELLAKELEAILMRLDAKRDL